MLTSSSKGADPGDFVEGDHVTNLREEILMARVKYSLTSMDEKGMEDHLVDAVRSLER